jgi:hypothetical protein
MREIIRNAMLLLIGTATVAQAGSMPAEGGSFLVTLFLGFFAVIVVFQLVPALILLGSMIKGLVSFNSPAAAPADGSGRKS